MNTPLRVETLAGPVERSQGLAGSMVRLIMTLLLFFTFLSSATAQPRANTESVVLRTGDVLFVGLPGEDTLNAEFRIDRRGMIWIPEVGSLKVSGLSLERAQAEVKQALTRYFRDLDGYEFQLRERRLLIQVQGHVTNPGTYELAEDVDLQGAITAAGGLRTGAQLDRMHIRRGDQILPYISPNIGVYSREPEAQPLTEYLQSLEQLKQLPADTLVLPAHNQPYTGLHTRCDELAKHHQELLDRLLAHCKTPQSLLACLAVLYKRKLSGQMLFFALAEGLAHLNHLLKTGLVTRQCDEQGVYRYQTCENC